MFRAVLRASVASVNGMAYRTDLKDGLNFNIIAKFRIIVPDVNPRHGLIPNDSKDIYEATVPTFYIRACHCGNTLPHTLNAAQLGKRIAALL